MFNLCRFLIIFFLFVTACQNNPPVQAAKPAVSDSLPADNGVHYAAGLTEQQVVNTILALKEVREQKKYIADHSGGQRHMSVLVEQKPDPTHPYFAIKIGEDTGEQLVTHFQFVVYTSPFRIMYYDVVNDKELTLQEWRRQKQ